MERFILHSDLNNFYAPVECLYNPSLRGKSVAVAGDPEARHGIALAKKLRRESFRGCHGKSAVDVKAEMSGYCFCPVAL